ncbi:MAG: TIGR03663 family protein [Chloroflexi bacterium]|nr:TIGR03663 family protein [Chloroflexota bacterium]
MAVIADERKTSFLHKPLLAAMTIDWERVIFIAIVALGIVTRLWDLPYRAWNHDEAIHTDWSWNLYTGRGYQHNPIYHGPFLYEFTAFIFFLFGDNDVTGRIPNALFGMVLVALPYFFRKWLGRKGALITAAMLLISPVVLYYSRFNRHDIYVEVFTVGMALAIWKYFDERKEFWLYATALLLVFAFAAMETTFIFAAVFAVFLCGHFTFEYLRPRVRWSDMRIGLFAAILGIPFLALIIGYQAFRSLRGTQDQDADWRAIPSFDLAMVFATLAMPLLTPAIIYPLNSLWQRISRTDFFSIAAFTDVNTLTSITQSQPDMILRVLGLTIAVILFSALFGMWWNARRWVICALLFWPIFIVTFTTVFTNGGGFFTGLLGSLGYWLSQQPVARGGQPSYYYLLVTLPEYEFLPYLVGLAAMVWFWWRYRTLQLLVVLGWLLWIIVYYIALRPYLSGLVAGSNLGAGIFEQLVVAFAFVLIPLTFFATYNPDDPKSVFPAFIFTWAIGVMVLFSWAGEKMPWLTMHLTIPLAFASGWALDKLLDADWRSMRTRGVVWLALTLVLAVVLLVMLAVQRPFQGVELQQLSATYGFLVVVALLLVVVAPTLYFIGRRFSLREIARVGALALVLLMAALTIRFAWMAVYINPDNAVETIIYAQGSHDNVTAMQEIYELSRRLCAQVAVGTTQPIHCDNGTIKVAYDDDSSWPFVWYLRNFRNAQYYGASPGAPFDAEVVIVGPKNEEQVRPFLGNKYTKRQYKLIWWPLEGYKDLTLQRVVDYIRDPQQRSDLFTAWFYHQYKESQSQWPYVHNFSFYVRKDVAAMLWNYAPGVAPQPSEADEYTKKTVQLTATRTFGSAGVGNGQFNYPRSVAMDAQGNIYVVDSDNHRIQKFDSTSKFVTMWGSKSPDNLPAPAGTFNQPWGIAVDKSGSVYVADTWNHRIQKFDSNGKPLLAWGTNGDTRGIAQSLPLQFYGPRAIALDAQGNVYVTDTGNKRVMKFSPNGEPLGQYGGVGVENGQFQEPVGLGIDKDGNVYVADTWNQRIQKFDSNFNFLAQWRVEAWDSQTVVNKPYVAIDADNNVFVTDPDAARVIKFSSDGKLLSVFGAIGVDLSSFNLPTGLAFDAQGNLHVADSGNQRVLIFSKP